MGGSFSRRPVNARSLFPHLLWPVNGIKQGGHWAALVSWSHCPLIQENETQEQPITKRHLGCPKYGSHMSYSQSDPFLALFLRLLYKILSPAPVGEALRTTIGLALSDSNRCLLRCTLEMLAVPQFIFEQPLEGI